MTATKLTPNAAKQVGRFIRARRLSLGLSRAELARRLGLILGSHVSHVERGEARISPDAMAHWAGALELDAAQFIAQVQALYGPEPAHTLTLDHPATSPAARVLLA